MSKKKLRTVNISYLYIIKQIVEILKIKPNPFHCWVANHISCAL